MRVQTYNAEAIATLSLASARRIKSKKRVNGSFADKKNTSRVSPLENAKLIRTSMNSVHSFASLLGLPREDISYIEKQFRRLHVILKATQTKLKSGYDELALSYGGVGNSEVGYLFVFSKATLLAQYGGVEIEEEDLLAICQNADSSVPSAPEDSMENIPTKLITEFDDPKDTFAIDFERWLPSILSFHRARLIMGLLAERRGRVPRSFLETQTAPEYGSICEFEYMGSAGSVAGPSILESPSIANTYTSNDLFQGYDVFGGGMLDQDPMRYKTPFNANHNP